MTPEQLLIPRFQVMSDYPFNKHFKVGDIITLRDKSEDGFCVEQPELNNKPNSGSFCTFHEDYFKKYPLLFREVLWWELRNNEDMPEYLKSTVTGNAYKMDTAKYDFGTESRGYGVGFTIEGKTRSLTHMLPITEDEYIAANSLI